MREWPAERKFSPSRIDTDQSDQTKCYPPVETPLLYRRCQTDDSDQQQVEVFEVHPSHLDMREGRRENSRKKEQWKILDMSINMLVRFDIS